MTVEKETRANSFIPVASGERVVTCCDQCNDSECNRSSIKKVTYYEKEDTHNSESHAQEKVNSSDVDSSDDENLPLLKLKMISCQRQDIRQVRNPITLVSDADSTSEETKSNGEVTILILTKSLRDYRILRIMRVVLCLWKNTDLHIPKKIFKLPSMKNRLL